VEVDGFEHHKERDRFNNDRYRGLVHRVNGWEVVRVSADHVYDEPKLVLGALDVGRALVA
jgi:very-short-patch-repair endonuclease